MSTDYLLGERVVLNQSLNGFRATIDPVLLAASIKTNPGERVLDLGCGSGAAALCLAARVPDISIDGLELVFEMVELGRLNLEVNNFTDRIKIIEGDIAHPPSEIHNEAYDHVMMNPPYRRAGSGNTPQNPLKAAAMVEGNAMLDDWVRLAWNVLCHKGSITIVHHADRLDDILSSFEERFGNVLVFPLWPDEGYKKPSKRVLVRAVKGGDKPLLKLPGLALHQDNGDYTPEAEDILRGRKAIKLGELGELGA